MAFGSRQHDDELGRYAMRLRGLPPAFESPTDIGAQPEAGAPVDLPGRAAELQNAFSGEELPPEPPPATPPSPAPAMQPPEPASQEQPDPATLGMFAQQRAGGAADPTKSGSMFFDGSQPMPTPNADPDQGARLVDAIFSGLGGQRYDARYWQGREQQRSEKASRDPNSAQSQQARQSASPLLRSLGLTDEEIAHISAKDIAGVSSGGQLMTAIAKGRTAAAHDRSAQAEKLAAEERANVEADRRAGVTGNTEAAKRERATIMAGTALGNQKALADYTHQLKNQGAQPIDMAGEDARLSEVFKDSASGTAPDALKSRLSAISNLPEEQRQQALVSFWKDVETTKNKPASFSDPLRVEDIEASGWGVGDPGAATRIINKRALTKQVAVQLADAKTSIESLDRLIANRKKYGSNITQSSQGRAADDRFYLATAKSNYQKAMGIANTNEGAKEVKHIFAVDPAGASGTGVGGVLQGAANQLGMGSDPVLEQLQAIRDEAAHNLTTKIPIPQLTPPKSDIPAWPAEIPRGKPSKKVGELGVTPTNGPKVNKVVNIHDPKTGRTGSSDNLTDDEIQQLIDQGFEVDG
jgi:hypothetical protein